MSLSRQPYKGIKRRKIEIRLPEDLLAIVDREAAMDGVSRTEKVKQMLEASVSMSGLTIEKPPATSAESTPNKTVLYKKLLEVHHILMSVYEKNPGKSSSSLGQEARTMADKQLKEMLSSSGGI